MDKSVNIKLLLLGDPSVGKTTFLWKYMNNQYKNNYDLTIGVDYATKVIKIDDKKINLQIWDTAGQESFRAITTSYFRSANCALIFFDVSNIDSYNNVQYWVSTYLSMSNNSKNSIFLLGNKCDNIMRDVSNRDCLDLANSLNILYSEISVKSNTINDLNDIIFTLLNNIDLKQQQDLKPINVKQTTKNRLLCGIKKCV